MTKSVVSRSSPSCVALASVKCLAAWFLACNCAGESGVDAGSCDGGSDADCISRSRPEVRATLVELGWSSSGGSASCGRCSVRDALREKLPWRILASSASICCRSVSVSSGFREWRSSWSSLYVFRLEAGVLSASAGLDPCRACFGIGRACHSSNLGS